MKILIADDHIIIRAGLRKLIETESDMEIAAEAEDACQALDYIDRYDFDILILDINMPGKSGLEFLREVKLKKPALKVLMLSIYPEDTYAAMAFELGASGYLSKDSSSNELITAIRKIHSGRKYISEAFSEKLVSGIAKSEIPHKKLSRREMEILLKIGEGCTQGEIAEELSLSVNTVATYRNRILEKMNMSTNAALIHYVIKNNLIK